MLDGLTIILGFTGSIGSGSTFIAKLIKRLSPSGYEYFKLSEIIRKSLEEKGVSSPSVQQMQDEGKLIRKEKGKNALVAMLIDDLEKDTVKQYNHIIIDGIKNDGEISFLRQFPNFYLFSIVSDRDIRRQRVVGERKPFPDDVAFKVADEIDEFENDINGQQVKKCNNYADIIINNIENFPAQATHQQEDFVQRIIRRYVELIENNVEDKISPQTSPSINELCMTMAYALSKKSSCLKRKVGAVIINSDIQASADSEDLQATILPHIIASGYNEVPAGAKKCIFDPDYQKCYRDHLQEEHARKIRHCPSCGAELHVKIACQSCGHEHDHFVKACVSCKREVKSLYLCPNCEIDIFSEHLPGNKNTPGKLLDLCRALHAEEMAILQLSKIGGVRSGNPVIFVTTQPCNLCANKIVTAGIKKVVFAEPYNMREAETILNKGEVAIERFEGVKSSAYFKLYH